MITAIAHAQQMPATTSADIYLGLQKLNVLGSVLYVAAHPDDENTRLLAYLSKDRLYRTGYLSLTRGDGGQNLIGNEQGVALGLIRTQELLAARRIDGAEQFFTRAYDFGFSKNPEETFEHWDKEKILSDVVWMIRKFQPDVIITRFPTTGEGGHGHHTASAILANEAFTAAADPKRFPEQLKYVQPWQAKRILWNTFNFSSINTQRPDQFKFDVGGYNAILGKGYGEIAAESRSQHKSQGFGIAKSRGEVMEYFATTGGAAPVNDLMDGVDLTWKKVSGSEQVAKLMQNLLNTFDFTRPQKSVPQLVQVYKALKALPGGYWRNQKLKEVQQLIEQAGGLWLDAFTSEPFVAQTDSVQINFSINDQTGNTIQLNSVSIEQQDSTFSLLLSKNKNLTFRKTIFVPESKSITQPYWLQNKMTAGYFNVSNQQLIGEPDVQPAFTATFSLTIEGEDFVFEKPVKYKYTDPVKGEIYQPFVVLPSVTFNEIQPFYLKNGKDNIININITANKDIGVPSSMHTYQTNSGKGDTLSLLLGPFSLKKKQIQNIPYTLSVLENKVYKINVAPEYNHAGYALMSVSYPHIPSITYFKEVITRVGTLDLKTAGRKIGYIVGAGDKVPEALEQMGYEVTLLGDKELSRNTLHQYDAIITGVRAYNTDSWLNSYYSRLMQYVKEGGNLIVQYNQLG
jgi:LmbE family N-acetylglucosaminyl deacetylase